MKAKNYNPPMLRKSEPVCGRVKYDVEGLTFTTGKGTGLFGAVVFVEMTIDSLKRFASSVAFHRAIFGGLDKEQEPGPWDIYGLPTPLDGINAYEVYLPLERLEKLVNAAFVTRWHTIGATSIPKSGSGSMKKK